MFVLCLVERMLSAVLCPTLQQRDLFNRQPLFVRCGEAGRLRGAPDFPEAK
jgi:hypothetical protein